MTKYAPYYNGSRWSVIYQDEYEVEWYHYTDAENRGVALTLCEALNERATKIATI